MNVRFMIHYELDQVLDLWCDMCREVDLSPSKVMWVQETGALLKSGNYAIIVAEKNGSIVGFSDYMIKPEPGEAGIIAISRYLYIDPKSRTFGAAKKLIDFTIEAMKIAGAKKVFFHASDSTMLDWESHGFNVKSTIHEKTL